MTPDYIVPAIRRLLPRIAGTCPDLLARACRESTPQAGLIIVHTFFFAVEMQPRERCTEYVRRTPQLVHEFLVNTVFNKDHPGTLPTFFTTAVDIASRFIFIVYAL
jgi:hypothetical protein